MAGNVSRYFQSTSTRQHSQEKSDKKARAPTFPLGVKRDAGSLHNPLVIDDDDETEESGSEPNFPLQPPESKVPRLAKSPEKSPDYQPPINDTDDVSDDISETVTRPANPFSQFAFQKASTVQARPVKTWHSTNAPLNPTTVATNVQGSTKDDKRTTSRKPKKQVCAFVPMKSLSTEEQEKITRKWLSLVDPSAPLEVRRFQVLVAARLHARCQEPSVRKAMNALREAFPEFTVATVAKAEPDILAHYITNLQYYNTKSQQIVKAANEIQEIFHGIVPEDETSLMTITGVGKVFADLLAFVNTRKSHESFFTNQTHESIIDSTASNMHPKTDAPN